MTARDLPDYHEVDGKLLCDTCGRERVVGEWGWCPHGIGSGGLEPLEPYVDANLLPPKDPRVRYRDENGRPGVLIETRSDRKKLMRELNIQFGSENHKGGREI